MARFVSKDPVKVSVEGSDDYVLIKAKLSQADRERYMGSVYEYVQRDGQVEVVSHLAKRAGLIRQLAIVGWHILDDDGNEIKYKPALLEEIDLDDPLWVAVDTKIAELNPTLSTRGSEAPGISD